MLKKESRMKVYFCAGFLAFILLAVCLVLHLEKRERAFAGALNSNVISVSSSDIQQAKEFYILTGLSESEAETKAIDYMKKREAMYVDALRHGYDVTDEEIWEFLDELKQTMEQSENKAEIEALISAFGTPEEYWQYEFTVYEKNLPIQNYVEDMEEQFNNQTETASSLDGAYEAGWDQYFENYKNRLVQENSFRIVQQ